MRTRRLLACGFAAISLAVAGCGEEKAEEARSGSGDEAPAAPEPSAKGVGATSKGAFGTEPEVTVPEGAQPPVELEVKDLSPGKGPASKAGDQLNVNYHGVSFSTGEVFDSSFQSGQPIPVELGAGGVIPGFEQGLEGMKAGGRRQITIPPELGYGAQGSPPAIGPNETLIFVLDLVSIK